MCTLTDKAKGNSYIGYKLVYKRKKNNYWSLAMGFKYEENKDIPIVTKQKRITFAFVGNILTSKLLYRKNMTGRTAVFENRMDAKINYANLKYLISVNNSKYEVGRLTIVKCRIYKDLMYGYYNGCKVIAGRRIKFLEEVEA